MAKLIAIFLVAAGCGVAWVHVLYWLGNGQGLANSEGEIPDWIFVAVLGGTAGFIGAKGGSSLIAGWLLGQVGFLTYDGMPRGRSPQMFMPTNFHEALLYAIVIAAILNWSIIPGVICGAFVRTLGEREGRRSPKPHPGPPRAK